MKIKARVALGGMALGFLLGGCVATGAVYAVGDRNVVDADGNTSYDDSSKSSGGASASTKSNSGGGGKVSCPSGSERQTADTYADCNLPATLPTEEVPTVAKTIINVLVSAVGIIAVLVIVLGGILYVISTGDTAKAKRAQNAILYGIVGLLIAVMAYAIVNFVLGSVF